MADKELKRIPLKFIRENPSALRQVNRQDPDYIQLVDSIRARGVINPIVVRELPSKDGSELYGLVDGLHRYTGSLDAGLDSIPAQVINMDDGDAMECQLIANAHKVETKPAEYSKQLQKILACNPTLTMAQLADRLNMTFSWLSERLSLLKLKEDIAGLVDEGKINLSNAYSLAKLPEEEQANFLDRAMTMSPQEFGGTVLARKKEIDQAKRQGKAPTPAEFVPVAHLQKMSDLKEELGTPKIGPILCREAGLKTPEEGFLMGLKWALHLDQRSIEAAKELDKQRKAALEAKKAQAAKERADKRAAEAAEVAAKVSVAG